MNLPLRYNIAQNTQYYITPKSSSPSIGKKRYRPVQKCKVRLLINVLVRVRKRSLFFYFRRSGIRSRWMFFVSFLRHSPSHLPEGNLVYFSIVPIDRKRCTVTENIISPFGLLGLELIFYRQLDKKPPVYRFMAIKALKTGTFGLLEAQDPRR